MDPDPNPEGWFTTLLLALWYALFEAHGRGSEILVHYSGYIALTKALKLVKPFKAGWISTRPDQYRHWKCSTFNKVLEQYFNKYSKEYGSLHSKVIDGINESFVRSIFSSGSGANMLASDFFESNQVPTFVVMCYVRMQNTDVCV
jgi:hypothetical protein